MPNVELMVESGMITLSEGEHIELLEALCRKIDAQLGLFAKSKCDDDQADALELIELYDKLNVGQPRVIVKADAPDLEIDEIVKALRSGAPVRKKRRK